jgi:crotonobetainyl-CoA:carnitine CoA-transferase CaiB-like acyl-CoA transferase
MTGDVKNIPTQGGALSGVNVLDLSRLLPGPYCSMILADHGARVIAAEDPGYAAEGLVTHLYRNKQHITLNLKTTEGQAIFERLARWADVLIEGFRPGVTERLGIDYAAVSRINPRTVYCSITGYGQTGPRRHQAGHDVNYLAYSGVLDLIGEADRRPCIPGIQVADIAAGGMNAAIGILMALLARRKTGAGQHIDISMTDGMVGFLPVVLWLRELTGQEPRRSDDFLTHRYACFNTYDTADGRCLSIGAVENRFWVRLCAHLGVPEYADLQYDESRREEILAFMRATFRRKKLTEWDAELAGLEVCYAPVRRVSEVLEDPAFHASGALAAPQAAPGASPAPTLGVPIRLSATPGAIRTPPAAFGTATRDVLLEFGFTPDEIEGFAQRGAILPESAIPAPAKFR